MSPGSHPEQEKKKRERKECGGHSSFAPTTSREREVQKQQQGFVIPPRHPPRLCSFSRQVIPTPAGLHPPVPNTTPQPWLPRCPSTACGRFGPQRLRVSAAAAGLARVGGQWRGASRHPTRRSGRRPAAWPSLRGWRMGAGTPAAPFGSGARLVRGP